MTQAGLGMWLPMQREQQKSAPDFDLQPLSIFSAVGGELFAWAGRHFIRASDNSPAQTDLGRRELTEQFRMISGRVPVTVGTSEVPNYVRDSLAYANETVEYFEPDLVRDIELEPPPNHTKLVVTTEAKLEDVVRGRRPLSDDDRIVDDWRRAGGDDGRTSFEKVPLANGR